ncbi:helix-turn-helix domain-containing protein, partial [Methylobacterium sp. J-048]|uniref:helix-turn-helix domain-containing protein n=1 Tax=Methylobacterium sp. J-048 TaxID=2836635 RepID=UPI001FBBB832
MFWELYRKLQAVGLDGNYRCPLPVTNADLADALGLTPVHISRVLQEMRGKTLITLRRRTLVMEGWNE